MGSIRAYMSICLSLCLAVRFAFLAIIKARPIFVRSVEVQRHDAFIQIQKSQKGPRTTGRMDGWTYYTAIQGIWNRGLQPHALHAITGRVL